ncbi:hypothetical protein MJO28_000157 [Puccinia striiformis f. sp. tritici]|uniref:Uncharacterized protein n=1 Tax=Puccinia striiformis f. sp. tritici TaxID=168172 RepID=A0ACC0F047_9BASI|nr:hypothetical protein MJO28_000157 [Puccinia striiformis f. sp. tritici]
MTELPAITTTTTTTAATSPSSPSSSRTPSPTTPFKTLPPPIPIPHLLLDRSRLKPVPKLKPIPAKIITPAPFNQLNPLRAKLRPTTTNNRSVSNPVVKTELKQSMQSTTTTTTTTTTSAEKLPTPPSPPEEEEEEKESTTTVQDEPTTKESPSEQKDSPTEELAREKLSAEQPTTEQLATEELSTDLPQDAHKNCQDQVQPWQHQLNPINTSTIDHNCLERANSAAARLDSLARLNGHRSPTLTDPDHSNSEDDSLPPFLMAKHIEETKKKAGLLSPLCPIPQYPLPLPPSLGFSVGPNGRGVPRLSALQRKALEKMAAQQDSQDLSTVTTSLTRSHTTTGTESPKHLANRFQSSSTDESDQRQLARSNLIRKLSSRDPNSRLKLGLKTQQPVSKPASAAPDQNQDGQNLPFTPEHEPPSSSLFSEPIHQDPVTQPQSELTPAPSHNIIEDPNQAPSAQGLTSSPTILESINTQPDNLPHTQTSHTDQPIIQNVSTTVTKNSPAFGLRYSFTSLDSQTDPRHATRPSYNNFDISAPDPDTIVPTNPRLQSASTEAQAYPRRSQAASLPVHTREHSCSELNPNQKSFVESPHSITEPVSEAILAPAPDLPTPSHSLRSSIVSRLKGRASLSSRIDRSTATGSPTPGHPQSRQSSLDHGSEGPAERRRSTINGNHRTSRPSNSSTLQRVRPATNETTQDGVRQSYTTLSSRVGSISPSNNLQNADRPLRPTRAPPITQAHNVVGGRTAVPQKSSVDLGPSQFPPTPHLVRTHMPVASASDLARYNDQKLAPFPALLNSSPPGSPERARSPPRSNPKNSKSQSHGMFTSASNFFRSPSRNQDENVTNPSRIQQSQTGGMVSPSSHPVSLGRPNEDQEEVVDSSRWQSIGDAAGKISASAGVSRSPTVDSNNSSVMSMNSLQRREQILARLSPFLRPTHPSTSPDHRLNDPPRKLLWHQPVLQVVNATSVKDRYLFLFNDLLVITKPVIEYEECKGERVPKLPITLKHSFLTKSIVEIKNLRCVCTDQVRRTSTKKHHPQNQSIDGELSTPEHWFQQAFMEDPGRAILSHLQTKGLEDNEIEITNLLITTTDLDKRQLGQYLTSPDRSSILKKYLNEMNLSYMRIEDGLRSVLLSIRLPADPLRIERFLEEFGIVWSASNPKIGIEASLVTRWATELIVLSEHSHDGLTDTMRYVAGFVGFPNELIKTESGFVDRLLTIHQSLLKDKPTSTQSLSIEKLEIMLKKSFQSVRRDRLVQARASNEDTEKIDMVVDSNDGQEPTHVLPSHIIYQIESDLITIKIPAPDPQFGIKLFGSGLTFEPSFLSFSQSSTASFRIKGKALGSRQISFIKIGKRAAHYQGLPLNFNVSVERAFMKDTVQVGFLNHLSNKRKYLYSFFGGNPKQDFLELIESAQKAAQFKDSSPDPSHDLDHHNNRSQKVAKSVALQVLIDSLILNEDLIPINVNPYSSTTVGLKVSNNSNHTKKSNKKPNSSGGVPSSTTMKEDKKTSTSGGGRIRSNSLSETYIHTIGKSETDLHVAILERRNLAQDIHIRKRQHQLLQNQLKSNLPTGGGKLALDPYSCSMKENPIGNADESENAFVTRKFIKVGYELIKHCEQNSLVPLVLSFLSMGIHRPSPLPLPTPSSTHNSYNQMSMVNSGAGGGNSHSNSIPNNNHHHHPYQQQQHQNSYHVV